MRLSDEIPIALRVFESSMVTTGYRIESRFRNDPEGLPCTIYRVYLPSSPEDVAVVPIDDDREYDEAYGWTQAAAAVALAWSIFVCVAVCSLVNTAAIIPSPSVNLRLPSL